MLLRPRNSRSQLPKTMSGVRPAAPVAAVSAGLSADHFGWLARQLCSRPEAERSPSRPLLPHRSVRSVQERAMAECIPGSEGVCSPPLGKEMGGARRPWAPRWAANGNQDRHMRGPRRRPHAECTDRHPSAHRSGLREPPCCLHGRLSCLRSISKPAVYVHRYSEGSSLKPSKMMRLADRFPRNATCVTIANLDESRVGSLEFWSFNDLGSHSRERGRWA